jgi:hypothetical protein
MASFYTATQQARKAGYNYLVSSDGNKTELPKIKTLPKDMPRNGWSFVTWNDHHRIIFVKDHKLTGFYLLSN